MRQPALRQPFLLLCPGPKRYKSVAQWPLLLLRERRRRSRGRLLQPGNVLQPDVDFYVRPGQGREREDGGDAVLDGGVVLAYDSDFLLGFDC